MHHKSRKYFTARLVLGTALVLVPLAGYPLGLGKLKVRSALNEPLRADIEFTSITEAELKGLSSSLASRADFEAAGAERLPFLSQIKFNVVRQPDGRHVLELRTDQAVQEPFLHLLLQIEWPGGRLVREYSALIDPPNYAVGKPSGIEAPRVAAAPAAVPEPIPEPPKAEVIAPTPASAAPAPEAAAPITPPAPTPEAPKVADAAPAAEPKAPEAPVAATPPADTETFGPQERREIVIASDSGWPDEDAPPKIEPLEPRAPEPTQAAEPPPATEAVSASTSAVPSIPPPPSGDYAVKKGDTLWAVAERARAEKDISVEQMSLAIFERNRDAFFGNNLNNLRAGKVLKMPEREQVTAISSADARRAFKAQYDSWQEYKLKLASASGGLKVADAKPAVTPAEPTPPPAPVAPAPAATPKPEARAAAGPEDRSKQPDELLRIVRSTLTGQKTTPDQKAAQGEAPKETARTEQNALAERASTLDESLESKQLEQKELGDKLGQVRSQIKNESRLLEIENKGLAKAQTQATPPSAQTESPKSADAPKAQAPTDAAKPQVAPLEAPKPVPAAPIPATAEKAPKKPAPAPVAEEKGFFASLLDDVVGGSLLPIVGGVLVLVGGVILIVYMRRRQRSIAEFEESILASDAVATDSAAPSDTTGHAVTTGDTSFLSDFSQGGMGNVHTDDVDPIAEAEVYLAYGRDETAEEILKEAVIKHPERHELKLKLLEIYHQRNDVAAFETLAEELYAALAGRGGKVWDKVEDMGRKLNPENPMFRGGAPAARRAGDAATTPSTAPVAASAAAAMAATTMVASSTADTTELAADFDFDTGGSTPAAAGASDGFSLDFASESAAAAPTMAVDFTPSTAPAAKADDGLDGLDLDRAFADNVVEFSSAAPSAASEDLGVATADDEIKWEVDAPVAEAAAHESGVAVAAAPAGDQQQWDETATKLDLAKAYIDMGDAEGARSILDEVLAEGTEDQKKQAAQLASQIA